MSDALKPCPFCGNEPVAEVFDTFGNSQDPAKCQAHVWLKAGYMPPRGTKLYAHPPAPDEPTAAEATAFLKRAGIFGDDGKLVPYLRDDPAEPTVSDAMCEAALDAYVEHAYGITSARWRRIRLEAMRAALAAAMGAKT